MQKPAVPSFAVASLPSRRRRLLRGSVGAVAVTGVVLASAATAFATDTSPAPTGSATAPAPASPSATASPTAPATPSTAAPAPTSAPPSPTASASDTDSDGQSAATSTRCTVTTSTSIGAGITAMLTISPSGPSVRFQGAGEDGPVPGLSLSRTQPRLPESAGFVAEILDPGSSHPRLRTNMEGGGHPAMVTAFPNLPQGCGFTYPTGGTGQTGQGGAGQTSVIPKGGVAAGYEATEGGTSPFVAIGGAAAAAGAASVAFVALRRRSSATR
ncbi:hypothetical protein [Streptomyces parvulus]|uniref:hypothetical protein n=1 Tax=Streptomyces parvulus TaxID=146923 RepID=UPI0037F42063